MANLLTTTRKPADHFISGALVAGIGTLSVNLAQNNKKDLIKKTAKMALAGGISAATAIHTSNQIAAQKYLDAVFTLGAGFGAVVLINKLIKEA